MSSFSKSTSELVALREAKYMDYRKVWKTYIRCIVIGSWVMSVLVVTMELKKKA